jgi:hypothetical protein
MQKSATKCNETLSKWCKNKHGASKIMDTLETYQYANFNGRSKHSKVGIFNDENVKVLISSRYLKMLVLQGSKWER